MSQVIRRHGNKPVNERVWIPSTIQNRGAADILDNQNITPVVRMDAFVTAAAEASVERSQTSAASSVGIKIGAHLDHAAVSTRFLGKQQGATNWIPSCT